MSEWPHTTFRFLSMSALVLFSRTHEHEIMVQPIHFDAPIDMVSISTPRSFAAGRCAFESTLIQCDGFVMRRTRCVLCLNGMRTPAWQTDRKRANKQNNKPVQQCIKLCVRLCHMPHTFATTKSIPHMRRPFFVLSFRAETHPNGQRLEQCFCRRFCAKEKMYADHFGKINHIHYSPLRWEKWRALH